MKIGKDNGISLSDKQLKLIEKLGIFGSGQGMPPASARITALLMVSDKLELTFDEIRETLSLSKSATSNGINSLLLTDKIEFITKTGDRKRYFRSKIASWKEIFGSQFQNINAFCDLLTEIRSVRTEETTEFNTALEELCSFIYFFLSESQKIYQTWETEQKSNK